MEFKEITPVKKLTRLNDSVNNSFMSEVSSFDQRDDKWHPTTSYMSNTSIESEDSEVFNATKEQKFVVFQSCLEVLLNKCNLCGMGVDLSSKLMGTT